ncbi:hypothetical protein HPB51_006555 [Rhipicephalus microplus]|uniref:Tick transposon n=1 Tax=Rhipicephalus microplus TaxID=6941 RepID=A0A9J6E6A2_RHIMP|nr:hypothetical protein HPB51_006555 [Rhipicephalus microplus]
MDRQCEVVGRIPSTSAGHASMVQLGPAGIAPVKVKFTIPVEIPVKFAIEISFKEGEEGILAYTEVKTVSDQNKRGGDAHAQLERGGSDLMLEDASFVGVASQERRNGRAYEVRDPTPDLTIVKEAGPTSWHNLHESLSSDHFVLAISFEVSTRPCREFWVMDWDIFHKIREAKTADATDFKDWLTELKRDIESAT